MENTYFDSQLHIGFRRILDIADNLGKIQIRLFKKGSPKLQPFCNIAVIP